MPHLHRRIFDTPYLPRLGSILENVRAGRLLLPARPRSEADDDDARWTVQLLDSIVRGIPIGALYEWRSPAYRPHVINAGPMPPAEKRTYLIDGVRRIGALLRAMYPAYPIPGEERFACEVFGSGEVRFRRVRGLDHVPKHMFPLSVIVEGGVDLYNLCDRPSFEEQKRIARKVENLRNVLLDYRVPIVPLVTTEFKPADEELEAVADFVARINGGDEARAEERRAAFLAQRRES